MNEYGLNSAGLTGSPAAAPQGADPSPAFERAERVEEIAIENIRVVGEDEHETGEGFFTEVEKAVRARLEELGLEINEDVDLCEPDYNVYFSSIGIYHAAGGWCIAVLKDGRHIHADYTKSYKHGTYTYKLDKVLFYTEEGDEDDNCEGEE